MTAHSLTRTQTQAVRTVMRLFAEEDLARGVQRTARRACACCDRQRPAAGFISYEDVAFCNACATAYELARMRHVASSALTFIRAVHGRGGSRGRCVRFEVAHV